MPFSGIWIHSISHRSTTF